MAWRYLTLEDAIRTHSLTIAVSGGGSAGHLGIGQLEAVLQHIQNDEYYPTLVDKLTHLFFGACKFHCFEDGNKRIAIALSAEMLLANGYLRSINAFVNEAENISYHVAAGSIPKELLGEWFAAILSGNEDDEALKLKVFNAISVGGGADLGAIPSAVAN